jgi:hypothetical protein
MEYSTHLKGPAAVQPTSNWAGTYDGGVGGDCVYVHGMESRKLEPETYPPGEEREPNIADTGGSFMHCIDVDWPASGVWRHLNAKPTTFHPRKSWMGSLLQHGRDASGQYYRRNRYYDAGTGRFTPEDPIGLAGGVNLYGYANGSRGRPNRRVPRCCRAVGWLRPAASSATTPSRSGCTCARCRPAERADAHRYRTMIRAHLHRLHSPDAHDLVAFAPEDPTDVGILVQAMIGPEGAPGAESFDFLVCTPSWLQAQLKTDGGRMGRHHLIVGEYDFGTVEELIRALCDRAAGADWRSVASYLGRYGKWEFEDYDESASAGL